GLAIASLLGTVWLGPTAWRYLSNRGELELMPQEGLGSVIVLQNEEGVIDGNKLRPAVTDWLDMTTSHTLKLPPSKDQLKAGTWPAGTRIIHWEVTTSGPLGSNRLLVPGEGLEGLSVVVTVGRGERVTVRAVVRGAPTFDANKSGSDPQAMAGTGWNGWPAD